MDIRQPRLGMLRAGPVFILSLIHILAQLNEQTQQRLSGVQLPSPETFLKNRREEIRVLEQNAVYLSGKLDLAQKQRQSSKDLSSGLTVRIQELQRELSLLEARQFENVNLEDLQEQLVQASEQYEELSGEAPETPDTAELDAKLQEFHAKLGARSSEVYQPKYTGPLAEDTAKVQALGKKYQQNTALLKLGAGEAKDNSKVIDAICTDLSAITGQKPLICKARK